MLREMSKEDWMAMLGIPETHNVCRQRGADGDQGLTQWNRTDQLFHEPQNFGELEF